ncbi:hypothetical protein ACLB2K_048142 [Fragaria x ananassa]
MARSRALQTTIPSTTPPSNAQVPNITSHQHFPPLSPTSSRTNETNRLQAEEISHSLQNELHHSIEAIHRNQESFQSEIASQIAVLQNTMMQALTLRPIPHSTHHAVTQPETVYNHQSQHANSNFFATSPQSSIITSIPSNSPIRTMSIFL